MTMVGMYTAGVTYDVTGKGFDPEAHQQHQQGKLPKHLCRLWGRGSTVDDSCCR